MIPVEFRGDVWRQKTSIPGPSCGVCVILRLAVSVEHRLIYRFTRYEAMNGGAKCRKEGGLGWLGALKVMGNASIR